jgi:Flp pilus assembly protein TadG
MLHHRDRAVTITSFALVAPVFLFIIFGTLEMSRVLNAWMVITNEAREAARYGAVNFDGTQSLSAAQAAEQSLVRTYLRQRFDGVLDPTGLYQPADVSLLPTGQNQSPLIQVTIYYQVPLVIPLVSSFLPNPFPIAARSAMRGE